MELNHKELLENEGSKFDTKFYNLNKAIANVLEDYSLIQMLTLNIKDEESLDKVLYAADSIIQYGESEEPQDNQYENPEAEDEHPEPMI